MTIPHRVVLAAALSWLFSATLGLLFAACASGRFSVDSLFLPGVVPVALFTSTIAALLMIPFAIWAARTGLTNMWRYGPILWLLLAAYVVLVIPRTGPYGPYGLAILAVVGAVVIGFIPVAE